MALTNFIPRQTLVTAEWLNKVDAAVENNINNQNIVTVDAITAVNATALGLVGGEVVYALGRSVAGDGGGGTFRYVAASTQVVDGGTVFQPTAGTGRLFREFDGAVQSEMFGLVGDGTNKTAEAALFVAYLNTNGGIGELGYGNFLIAANTLTLTRVGAGIKGKGKGNCANVFPAVAAPTTVTITGTGPGAFLRNQDCSLSGFRLTSDVSRAALTFDITQPGVRVEPEDTSSARADRCNVDLRIDNQPGDGFLCVGLAVYGEFSHTDCYNNKGFGFRFDDGSYTGIVRTNKSYPGLFALRGARAGFNGGHGIAISNPLVTTQAGMGIRCTIDDFDSFGNGINTAIMYPAGDGNFYDFWMFTENSVVIKSAPCGRSGLSLTPEILGGIWIAGRDNQLIDNRYIDTKQPIYWGYVSAQPSTGLEVNMMRIVNTSLTHTDAVKVESALCVGLRMNFDRYESFTNPATRRIGADPINALITYRGNPLNAAGVVGTGVPVSINDDQVLVVPILGASGSVTIQGVLTVAGSAASAGGGIFHVRFAPTTPLATKWAGETSTVAYGPGGALTGTTGTDGNLTISADNTNLYIENRRGFLVSLTFQLSALTKYASIV